MRMFILLLAVLLILTGCTAEKSPEIGLCIHAETVFTQTYAKMISDALKQQGCRVTICYSHNNQTTQNRQLQRLIDEGCDGLVISPVMIGEAEALVQTVKNANIPAVFVSREPAENALAVWDRVSYVGCDPAGAGKAQAQLLLNTPNRGDVDGDGVLSYVVLQGQQESLNARDRTDHALRTLWDAGVTTDELRIYCTDGQKETATRTIKKALKDFPEAMEAVLCNTDTMALAVMEVLQQRGVVIGKEIYLLGMDGTPRALKQVLAGKLTGTVLEDYPRQARHVAITMQQMLSGQSVQKHCYVPHIPIDRENAAQYIPWWQ